MATEKKITSRIQQKHDVAANWAKATNFIPKKGEIIIYDAEYNTSGEETQAVRFKIGDGSKTVNNLPFAVIDYSSDIETLEQKVANNSTAIGALQENTVPKTRKINNKALSSDITLGAADVGVNETTFPGLKKTGTVTGVKMNGTTKNPSSGVVDLGTVLTDASKFATSAQGTKADNAMPKSGGTFTGNISVPKTITFTDTTNPYIKMTTGGTDFYFQSTSGQFGLGPTWDKATHWDSNGNVTFPTTPKVGSSPLALKSDIPSAVTESTVSGWGFTKNKGTVTSVAVKMNGATKGTVTSSGTIDLGTVITSHQGIKKLNTNNTTAQDPNASEAIVGSGTINLHKVAKTGSYNDLSNKPTFVSSVNGSSGAITNVAKTDETNVFTNSQIILKPSDETQASLWNYSGCIGYSHWVQGSSSEPRIGIGYKSSGIRVFNGTTEAPAQYYDVTMPPQAGQLVTDTFAKFTGETSGIANPYRVFPNEEVYAAYKSTSPGTPLDFKYTSQTYSTFIANTDANSRSAFTDGRIVNKKNGTNYELTLPTKTGTLAITSDIPAIPAIKTLDTTNTNAQMTSSSEQIKGSGTIRLHKVSKTGSYNDLNYKHVNFIGGSFVDFETFATDELVTIDPSLFDPAPNDEDIALVPATLNGANPSIVCCSLLGEDQWVIKGVSYAFPSSGGGTTLNKYRVVGRTTNNQNTFATLLYKIVTTAKSYRVYDQSSSNNRRLAIGYTVAVPYMDDASNPGAIITLYQQTTINVTKFMSLVYNTATQTATFSGTKRAYTIGTGGAVTATETTLKATELAQIIIEYWNDTEITA